MTPTQLAIIEKLVTEYITFEDKPAVDGLPPMVHGVWGASTAAYSPDGKTGQERITKYCVDAAVKLFEEINLLANGDAGNDNGERD